MQPPPFENDRYASQPEPPQPKWYRFTLRKVVIGFVLLCVLFAYLRYTHWGYVATEAITKLGRSVGLVDPPDTSKIQVTAARPFGVLDYEWRISIPANNKYMICTYWGEIDKDAFPPSRGYLLPNESLVTVRQERGSDAYSSPGIGHRVLTFDGVVPFETSSSWQLANVDWTDCQLETTGVRSGDGQQTFELGEKIALIRSVVTQHEKINGRSYSPGYGFFIWLEPAP
ncbi:hypothetical protein [Blastopirellula marina]|uniref:Uncharacterized protein n=1 Tax=Blastopirellula marina TaxID=124 RepID=A0A2S8F6C7_9BACT|nr:hypothetical protein [Blastopirellula marina]PQO27706.1 hypothetical protein C5Y98_26775 [Blastopirellula marina]PTL41445.1 hypothetical protein C5Y97_26790 [Blastopirellula marina]